MSEKLSETEQIIINMLTEEIDKHMCDSGGVHGYGYEKMRKKGVEGITNAPEVTVEGTENDYWFDISTYHYLVTHLEYTPYCKELTEKMIEMGNSEKYKRESWNDIIDMMLSEMENIIENHNWYNTYNDPDRHILDKVLLFKVIKIENDIGEEENIVILKIHNGCDVRGGYTIPRFFKAKSDDLGFVYFMADFSMYTNKYDLNIAFYTDDGRNFYGDNTMSNPKNIVVHDKKIWYRLKSDDIIALPDDNKYKSELRMKSHTDGYIDLEMDMYIPSE